MAIRYLAQIHVANGEKATASLHQQDAFQDIRLVDGTTVAINGDYLALPDGTGIIVGHLFSREVGFRRVQHIDLKLATAIISSKGQVLIDGYWGGYVAILSALGNTVEIVRDPSGTVPCFYAKCGTGTLISSDVDLLQRASNIRFAVDWRTLIQHLRALDLRRAETCLTGVRELLAGHRLCFGDDKDQTHAVWSPWNYSKNMEISDDNVARSVRRIVDGCAGAWGRCYNRIGVSLSGGLDSSIVAAGLRDAIDRLHLVTMATDEAEGDERHYARLVADYLGTPLTEKFYGLDDVNIASSASAHLPRPVFSPVTQAEIAIKTRLEADVGLDVFFAGHGGDNVFCNMQSASPVIDRLRYEGLTPGVISTFDDVCELTGCSVWEALGQLRPKLLNRDGAYRWKFDDQFLNQEAIIPISGVLHPWLVAPKGSLPGKAAHIAMLVRIQGTIDGFSRELVGQINPLLSQPVVEACLAIPTWQWISGGANRSIARLAYASILPDRVVHRLSKGGPGHFAFQIIETNRDLLRGQLLDGLLAKHGLLDLPALAETFDLDQPIDPHLLVRLSFLAEAESWARHWDSKLPSGIAGR